MAVYSSRQLRACCERLTINFPLPIWDEQKSIIKLACKDRDDFLRLISTGTVVGFVRGGRVRCLQFCTLIPGVPRDLGSLVERRARIDQIKGLPLAGDPVALTIHKGGRKRPPGPVYVPVIREISRRPSHIIIPMREAVHPAVN